MTLLNKAFETALLNGHGTANLFFQLLLNRFKDAQTSLLHASICSLDLKQLRETELKYAERFVLGR
ncbi:hypothetical protein ABMC88_13985 [Sulfitobacter sp. HNIBRBA2951]|uniref:hypothetical protein n=1 Tax=Sulfitobacter aquimarinus TaxID=3158557 RepID=UPI0032DED6BA